MAAGEGVVARGALSTATDAVACSTGLVIYILYTGIERVTLKLLSLLI